MPARDDAPPGFVRASLDGVDAVCRPHLEPTLRTALVAGTLYDYARSQSEARRLTGRAPVFAIPFPDASQRVVIRHNHHGGAFARLTRDLFRAPGRAPIELAISERLRALRVPTPEFAAYAIYRAPLALCRSDVATMEIADSFDLSAALMSDDAVLREQAWGAALRLVHTLSAAGARHADLNVKNVLLRPGVEFALDAIVLDVDRVVFGGGFEQLREANLARLLRSARKWRDLHGARLSDAELSRVQSAARANDVSAPARVRTP
ncbi:MAG TPA: lipopolysaccharide kinase InaA family protein [Gemmatimonadaceae bacterium]|nr:lipopolysaccharide kinase InaA family protein [Gemmatimonadaceae bacterium]